MYTLAFCYLLALNVATFFVYGLDKLKAKRGSWRIAETSLLLLAIFGGSIGALLALKIWRHKTKHKKFAIGLPLILAVQVIVAAFAFVYLPHL